MKTQQNTHLNSSLNMLIKNSWDSPGTSPSLTTKLMVNYLHQVAAMDSNRNLNIEMPFFKPDTIIEINQESYIIALDKLKASDLFNKQKLGHYDERACKALLYWSSGIDQKVNLCMQYPSLFDPLISYLQGGGRILIRKNELIVENGAIPLQRWKKFKDR